MKMEISIESDTLVATKPPIENIHEQELKVFLKSWDETYKQKAALIPLFMDTATSKWNSEQKRFFVKIFYHVRGHFHDFLWHMGNHAESKRAKEIILHNIMEEFGGHAQSHEKLYIDFAKSLGAHDINDEILNQQNNLSFIQKFNYGHIEWLMNHKWDDNLSLFSAYERLDNVDYTNLMKLIKSLGVPEKDSVFFKVHMGVKHFEATETNLLEIWIKNKQIVIDAFKFIASHQLQMWENLSNVVEGYT